MICPTIVSLVLTALSPAAWNLRNRLRISLWSAFSITIASDDMLLLSEPCNCAATLAAHIQLDTTRREMSQIIFPEGHLRAAGGISWLDGFSQRQLQRVA